MKPRVLPLLLFLVAAPGALRAQRGGRGGMGGMGGRGGGGGYGGNSSANGLQLSNGDVEEMSPIKRIIDKRKDLGLSDSQVKQLKEIEARMKDNLKPQFKILDSLREATKVSSRPTGPELDRSADARSHVPSVVSDIRSAYDTTLERAMQVLSESQQKPARELVQQQNLETEAVLKEKLNGRGRGEGGNRRGEPPA